MQAPTRDSIPRPSACQQCWSRAEQARNPCKSDSFRQKGPKYIVRKLREFPCVWANEIRHWPNEIARSRPTGGPAPGALPRMAAPWPGRERGRRTRLQGRRQGGSRAPDLVLKDASGGEVARIQEPSSASATRSPSSATASRSRRSTTRWSGPATGSSLTWRTATT
jgi:hypothetical protein